MQVRSPSHLSSLSLPILTSLSRLQTTLDLLEREYDVHVLADGISSCNGDEVGLAIKRMRDAGAHITTSESILFQIMRTFPPSSATSVCGCFGLDNPLSLALLSLFNDAPKLTFSLFSLFTFSPSSSPFERRRRAEDAADPRFKSLAGLVTEYKEATKVRRFFLLSCPLPF